MPYEVMAHYHKSFYSHNQTITSAIILLPAHFRSLFSGAQSAQMQDGVDGVLFIEEKERNFGSRVAQASGRADPIYPDF